MDLSKRQLAAAKENSETAHHRLLEQVEEDLSNPPGRMMFSKPVERRFQEAREDQRRRHFIKVGLAGFLSFDLFLFAYRLIMPDIFPSIRNTSLGVITPLALVILFLIYQRKLPPEIVFFNLCMTFGANLAWSAMTHSTNSVFCFFMLPLFFVFSNIGYPLPFKYAAIYTAACLASLTGTILWVVHLDHTVQFLMLVISSAMGGYTLVACHRLEAAERRNYLLTLREALRGEVLLEKNRELRDLSETDQLTGVANRRVFDRELDQLWSEHLQSRTPLALLIIDIDHFKRLNDTYGHAHGDICLRKAADRLACLMRPHQTLARYGGEEFAVLLEGEGAYRAAAVAERLRAEIEALQISLTQDGEGKSRRITVSIGCATVIPRLDLAPSTLFASADKALYAAKHAGRNRVCAHTIEPAREMVNQGLESSALAPLANLWKN